MCVTWYAVELSNSSHAQPLERYWKERNFPCIVQDDNTEAKLLREQIWGKPDKRRNALCLMPPPKVCVYMGKYVPTWTHMGNTRQHEFNIIEYQSV